MFARIRARNARMRQRNESIIAVCDSAVAALSTRYPAAAVQIPKPAETAVTRSSPTLVGIDDRKERASNLVHVANLLRFGNEVCGWRFARESMGGTAIPVEISGQYEVVHHSEVRRPHPDGRVNRVSILRDPSNIVTIKTCEL